MGEAEGSAVLGEVPDDWPEALPEDPPEVLPVDGDVLGRVASEAAYATVGTQFNADAAKRVRTVAIVFFMRRL